MLGAALASSAPAARAEKIRIAAANLSSGNYQNYDPGHGARILQGLKPDICLIQEFNTGSNSAAAIRSFVDVVFGPEFYYYRESGAQIPNGIISRHPIIASGTWDDPSVTNRDFAWARLDIPGDKDLWAVSVHLLTNDNARPAEAVALRAFIQAHIPTEDYLVVGGDFNSDTRTESALSTLGAVVVTSGPQPADQDGIHGTNLPRSKPYDAVYADAELEALQIAVVTGQTTFAHNATRRGAVIDTRVYQAKGRLADIAPALADDSSAPQMQHMAVVKDFFIPATPPPGAAELEIVSSSISLAEPHALSLTFRSTPGAVYEMRASPALAAETWDTLGEITAAGETATFIIVARAPAPGQIADPWYGEAPQRFYRVQRK